MRNRWKRAIREAFRLHKHKLPAAYDMVVAVAWEGRESDLGRIEQAFVAVAEALREKKKKPTITTG